VSYPIIHIHTYNSINEIESLVVVFIPLQLTLGRMVECIRDHVHLLDDLPNGVTMAQKIVVSLIFLVIEILTIEVDIFEILRQLALYATIDRLETTIQQ
jgi:hypothetical protein